MPPANDEMLTEREIGQRGRWYKPVRCSICMNVIWRRPTTVKEPVDAPEPRQEWIICLPCYEMLQVEIRRSPVRSPARLRVAVGLVAAERSPLAITMRPQLSEQEQFQREFTWFKWFLVILVLMHLLIFVVIFAVPK